MNGFEHTIQTIWVKIAGGTNKRNITLLSSINFGDVMENVFQNRITDF